MKNLILALLTIIILSLSVSIPNSYAGKKDTTVSKTDGDAVYWEKVQTDDGTWWWYGYDSDGHLVSIVPVG